MITLRSFPFRLLLCGLSFSIHLSLIAQRKWPGTPFIQSWAVSEYHGGTQSWGFSEDREGRLLVANKAGLLRFDGQRWELFPLNNGTIARSLSIDKITGQITVGGQGTFGTFEATANGGLQYRPLSDQLTDTLRQTLEDVWRVLRLPDGRYCFNTTARLIMYGHDGRYERPIEPVGSGNFEFAFEQDGKVFAFEEQQGLWQGIENYKPILVPGSEKIKNDGVAGILKLADGTMLVASHSLGLFRSDGQTFTQWPTTAQDFFKKNHLYCALRLSDGSLAFGTTRGGCLVLSPDGKPLEHYSVENGLPVNFIRSLGEDHFGNLWMGLDNGIACSLRSAPFRQIFPHEGRPTACFSAIVQNDLLWIADAEGVSCQKNKPRNENALFESIFEPLAGVPISGESWRLDIAPDGRFLLGQHRGAFEIKNQRATLIDSTLGGWRFLPIPGKKDWLLEGTYHGLVAHPPPGTGKPFPLAGFSQSCRILAFDTKHPDELWVSHIYRGIYHLRINLKDRLVINLGDGKPFGRMAGLGSDYGINVFEFDTIGPIFGTLHGVFRFNHDQNKFIKAPEWDNWLGGRQHLQNLTKGLNGRWWWVADNQLGYFDLLPNGQVTLPADRTIFKKLDSTFVKDFEFLLPLPDGNLLIGTTSGCILWDNTEWVKQTFNTLIRRVSLLPSGAFLSRNAVLNADENDIRIEFAAPFFEDPSKTVFACRLEGYKNDTAFTSIAEKEYHNLPPGRYTFHVIARNLYGVEGREATFSFQVRRPWYWYLFWLIVAGLVVYLYLWRRNSMRQIESFIEMTRVDEGFTHPFDNNDVLLDALAKSKNWPDIPPPEYVKTLKNAHPSLSDSKIQLAWLIAIDRQSAYIIRTLHLGTPESLASRRWELKQKLALEGHVNLRDYLHGLLENIRFG